jgi:hypothetical protein
MAERSILFHQTGAQSEQYLRDGGIDLRGAAPIDFDILSIGA